MTRSTVPERIVLAIAAALVSGVLIALLVQWVGGSERPAEPAVAVTTIRHQRDDRWAVDVEVTNRGDGAAMRVEVIAELQLPDGGVESGTQTVDVIAPGEVADLVFTFSAEPTRDTLSVRASGHTLP